MKFTELDLSLFENSLREQSYKEVTDKGLPSTVPQYVRALKKILEREKINVDFLAKNIDQFISDYDKGGCKEHWGYEGNATPISALKRFKDYTLDKEWQEVCLDSRNEHGQHTKKELTATDIYNVLKNVSYVAGVGQISCTEKYVSFPVQNGCSRLFKYEAILKSYESNSWSQPHKEYQEKYVALLAKKVFDVLHTV